MEGYVLYLIFERVVPLEELKKERDAFRKAKAGIIKVMQDLRASGESEHPELALQKLIDFADRRIVFCDAMIEKLETVS